MNEAHSTITTDGIVAIVRRDTPEQAEADVWTLIKAGLRVIEISLVTPSAIDVIGRVSESVPDDVILGVGTVRTAAEVTASAAAGARFIVSPVVDERVIGVALDAGLETLPGAATPTEALKAMEWGSRLVKIFPASLWSPLVLREVLTALPDIQAVPTGGVSLESAPSWIRAGAIAVGIGGALTKSSNISTTAAELLRAISTARG